MKKVVLIFISAFLTLLYAKPNVIVSILPQKTFVEKIAKDKINLDLMVSTGSSPHSYEPKASQMKAISNADIYFSIGVEFEHVWLKKFSSQNQKMKIIDLSDGITKIQMQEHEHGDHVHEAGDDPHIWASPKNVKIMALKIYDSLQTIDPQNREFYKSNLDAFLTEIKQTDDQIKEILKDVEPKSKFMVFHPSWGYFAQEYNLVQLAIEVEGKEPKPKDLMNIIHEVKEEKIKTIIAQMEFSDKSAKLIAKEANVAVVKLSTLSEDWSQNLIKMATTVANK